MDTSFIRPMHIRHAFALFLTVFAIQSVAPHAVAEQILFDNRVTNIDSPYWSDISNGQLLADDFALTGSALLSEISWSGVYGGISPLSTDFFEIRILQDVDPTSDVRFLTLHSIQTSDVNRVDSGTNFGSLDIFRYRANVSDLNIELNGSETYWISIFNETSVSEGGDAGWAWSAEDNRGTMASTNPTRPWGTFSSETDFQLSGEFTAVPEPATGLVLGTASLVAFLRRRSI